MFLPSNQKSIIKANDRYDRIKFNLTSNLAKIRLQFVLFLCENLFERFLTWFQQEGPLIHVVYDELWNLYRNVLLQFLKPDCLGQAGGEKILTVDFKLNEYQLNQRDVRIGKFESFLNSSFFQGSLFLGENTRKLLGRLEPKEREVFFDDVKTVYHAIARYFQLNLPLKNTFLRDVRIIHPLSQKVYDTDQIVRVARAVPNLLSNSEIDRLRDEWLSYALEDIDEEWFVKEKREISPGHEEVTYQRLDFYWNHVFFIRTNDGRIKYPTLSKLIKNILILPHGNADVERGFSINENIVRENRHFLSEPSINGLRCSHDAVKCLGNGSSHRVGTCLLTVILCSRSFSSAY